MRLYKLRLKIQALRSSYESANAKIDPLFAKILIKAKERTEALGDYILSICQDLHSLSNKMTMTYTEKKQR